MPGPVSDSYDPEFSTGANADDVRDGIEKVVAGIGKYLGPQLKNIVEVVQGKSGNRFKLTFTEQQLRIIRFGLKRALESI